jgi:hypothetical protein
MRKGGSKLRGVLVERHAREAAGGVGDEAALAQRRGDVARSPGGRSATGRRAEPAEHSASCAVGA